MFIPEIEHREVVAREITKGLISRSRPLFRTIDEMIAFNARRVYELVFREDSRYRIICTAPDSYWLAHAEHEGLLVPEADDVLAASLLLCDCTSGALARDEQVVGETVADLLRPAIGKRDIGEPALITGAQLTRLALENRYIVDRGDNRKRLPQGSIKLNDHGYL